MYGIDNSYDGRRETCDIGDDGILDELPTRNVISQDDYEVKQEWGTAKLDDKDNKRFIPDKDRGRVAPINNIVGIELGTLSALIHVYSTVRGTVAVYESPPNVAELLDLVLKKITKIIEKI